MTRNIQRNSTQGEEEAQLPTETNRSRHVKHENKVSPNKVPDETLRTVAGSVTRLTLLQTISINKVEVELQWIKKTFLKLL